MGPIAACRGIAILKNKLRNIVMGTKLHSILLRQANCYHFEECCLAVNPALSLLSEALRALSCPKS